MNHEKHESHEKIIYKEESYKIQVTVFEVYREMGCGFKAQVINFGSSPKKLVNHHR